jgi:hypothetical protein
VPSVGVPAGAMAPSMVAVPSGFSVPQDTAARRSQAVSS